MALTDDEKLEVKKLIRAELIDAAVDIAERFEKTQTDPEVLKND